METSETHPSCVTPGEPGNAFYKPSDAITGQHQVCHYTELGYIQTKNGRAAKASLPIQFQRMGRHLATVVRAAARAQKNAASCGEIGFNLRPTKSIVWLSLLHKALSRQDTQSADSTLLPHSVCMCLCGGFQAGGTRRVAMLSLPTEHWESRQVLLLRCALLQQHRGTRASVLVPWLMWFVYLFWTLRERNVSDAKIKWKTKTTKTKRPKMRNPNC